MVQNVEGNQVNEQGGLRCGGGEVGFWGIDENDDEQGFFSDDESHKNAVVQKRVRSGGWAEKWE